MCFCACAGHATGKPILPHVCVYTRVCMKINETADAACVYVRVAVALHIPHPTHVYICGDELRQPSAHPHSTTQTHATLASKSDRGHTTHQLHSMLCRLRPKFTLSVDVCVGAAHIK